MPSVPAVMHLKMLQATNAVANARAQIDRAASARRLKEALKVPLPVEIRGIKSAVPGCSALRGMANLKAMDLVREQVFGLAKLLERGDRNGFETQLNQLRVQEWPHLRGTFPRACQYVERETQRLLGKLGQLERSAGESEAQGTSSPARERP